MELSQLLTSIRQDIREEGFIGESELIGRIKRRAREFSLDEFNVADFVRDIPCVDIKVQAYALWLTRGRQRKYLYYFEPE